MIFSITEKIIFLLFGNDAFALKLPVPSLIVFKAVGSREKVPNSVVLS